VIANTADDDEFWGLLVCPDVDAVIYRLAGVFNETAGYGVKDDSFHVLDALVRLGEPAWFRIGDKDFATHLVRAEMLRRGCTLTECALALGDRFGIGSQVLPMTDEKVRTRFETEQGELSFQEYFVRERLGPPLRGIQFAGIESARATPEVVSALDAAELVIIGPSNPLISIAPILKIAGRYQALDGNRELCPTGASRQNDGLQRNRSSAAGRTSWRPLPFPRSARPRTMTAGARPVLPITRPAAAARSSATASTVA